MITVKITVACAGDGFAFYVGEEAKVSPALAADLIRAGYAEPIGKKPPEMAENAASKAVKNAEKR